MFTGLTTGLWVGLSRRTNAHVSVCATKDNSCSDKGNN